MAHPLELKIGQVRSRARRLLAFYALGWTIAAITACVVLLGLADYWIRFADRGIRFMASATAVLVSAWAAYRFWIVGLGRKLSDVQLALQIERRFPVLRDRLASSVQFLKQGESDAGAGSATLRRALILETASDVQNLDLSEVFERRPTRRALAVGGVTALVAISLVLAAPGNARLALMRLAQPFGNDAWPRFYRVEFKQSPSRLAAGQTFEVELIADAAHRVPDDARIYYRYEDPAVGGEEEIEPMHNLAGLRVARKESVSRPFWYRASGGDDDSMEWLRLEVVEPPRLESLRVTLHPPAYSGMAVANSEKSIHALRGTKVELAGSSTKKLRRAEVHQENGPTLAAAVAADGYKFSLAADASEPMVIDKSGPYWVLLQDSEGLEGGAEDQWDIRAVADLAPSVTIEQPVANLFVTPDGEVSIKVVAKDDLVIHDVALHFSRSDRTDVEDFTVPLYQGPQVAAAQPIALASGQLGESRVIEHRWPLADLNIKSGSRITFWATAADYLPQSGKSTPRTLNIITKSELEDRLAQRQTLILGELQRVLKLEQDARAGTKLLEIQIDQVGQLTTQDIDNAQATDLNQRQVTRTLTSPNEGIPAQIADFLADLASNRVDSPDVERHMNAILQELERLAHEHLPTIERELTSAIKAAQTAAATSRDGAPPQNVSDPSVKESLSAVGQNQDQVIASLENMLTDLGQWDNYRRFAREVAQLQRDQEEISRATSQIGQKTLGRDLKDLDAQQQADLRKLANLEGDLSRRLEKTQQQMGQMSGDIKQSDPLSSATIADGLHHAQERAISGQMRQASGRLENNQLGQAQQQQAKIVKDLEDLASILSNRREQELTRLVKQLREAERELERLRTQQGGLRKQIAAAAAKPDSSENKRQLERLAQQEKQLQEEVARLARKLERLQAEAAGRTAAGAANKMGQAGSSGQQGDAAAAGEQAEKAEKDLEEAQQQLAERRKAAEEDLAREQMAKLEDSLKSLHDRQKKLIAETERLQKLRTAEGRLTRSQASSVHELARGQKTIETETDSLAEKLAVTEVIALALRRACDPMQRAARLLEDQRTDTPTQEAQETARLRLAQLLVAFENKPKADGQGGEGGGGGGGSGGGRNDGNYVLAQLKLIKILQEDLNGRFHTLAGGDDSTVAGKELAQVAEEQGKLADLALKLAAPPESNPEDDPEKLPDVRRDDPLIDEAPQPGAKEPS